MKIRRIGNTRPSDHTGNTWNVANPNSLIPGDVLSGAPAYGGQSLREAPGPVVLEEHMAVHEPAPRPKARGRKPKVKAILPPDADMNVSMPGGETPMRTAINLRIPTRLLNRYKSSGPKYQSRIIAVLEMFVREGGTFTEE